jgi:hypothetical protein
VDATNPDITVTQNGSSYTLTPAAGFYGVQALEITAQSATAPSWDSGSGVNPVYGPAYVPVYVDPPAPQIASISVGGQAVTGSTTADNSSPATVLSFHVTGAVAGALVSVYIAGDATPIATGTVAAGATTVTVSTDGKTQIAAGNHEFIVEQSLATPALDLFANFGTTSSGGYGPAAEFQIPASSVDSPASAGTALTIGPAPVAPSGYTIAANQAVVNLAASTNTGFTFTGAEVGTMYTYNVASSGGGSPVAGSGTVTSATQQVTGIDVSSLSDGTLTFSVSLTDTSGDVGVTVTAAATLDTSI